ncbi:hypothetical protein K456DRAFT_44248 [Colletotrichum gloeosporioides 23]|nr:hypothetical protein K456DRAFT_44248 [Colletotrichum gloeosporioides 23]
MSSSCVKLLTLKQTCIKLPDISQSPQPSNMGNWLSSPAVSESDKHAAPYISVRISTSSSKLNMTAGIPLMIDVRVPLHHHTPITFEPYPGVGGIFSVWDFQPDQDGTLKLRSLSRVMLKTPNENGFL